MPGGRRNPLSISRIVETVQQAKHHAKEATTAAVTKSLAKAKLGEIPFVDIQIQFIGASGLPRMDVVGSADPYFVANVDEQISFVSAVIPNTLNPVWNEVWRIKNVPSDASLSVEVLDKDEGAPHDDYIGKFSTTISAGAKEAEIEGPLFRRDRGTFWIKIESKPSTDTDPLRFPYLFDGPLRFSQHLSPTVGRLTNLPGSTARLYSTWKLYLRGVPLFFHNTYQPWNANYRAAQSIFSGPASPAVRAGIQAGHRMLYARSARNSFGTIDSPSGIFSALLNTGGGGEFGERVKPAVYTYIISAEDDSFRFSETGAAFFVDFASKHALHANCAESVRYSGEFHPRPRGGWEAFSDDVKDSEVDWEIVIDNNSGTYAPDKALLPALKGLLEYNFGFGGEGVGIVALDHGEGELERSREACRDYGLRWRGVKGEELQPHVPVGFGEGEEQGGGTLLRKAEEEVAVEAAAAGDGGGPLGVSLRAVKGVKEKVVEGLKA